MFDSTTEPYKYPIGKAMNTLCPPPPPPAAPLNTVIVREYRFLIVVEPSPLDPEFSHMRCSMDFIGLIKIVNMIINNQFYVKRLN